MQQYFQLYAKEKRQEWLMLAFALAAFVTIGIGVYNQYHNINQDYILIPFCMAMFGSFFLVYSINGLTKGNLTKKWTPFYIFQVVVFLIKTFSSLTKEKAMIITIKLLATLGLVISLTMFASAIFTLVKPN